MSLDLTISKNRSKSSFGKLTFTNKRGEKMPIVNGIPVNPSKPRPPQNNAPSIVLKKPSGRGSRQIPPRSPPMYNSQRVSQWVNRNGSSGLVSGPQISSYPQVYNQTLHLPPTNPIGNAGIQNQLNENSFRQYLDGFVEISKLDLPTAPGSRLRYCIDTISGGRVVSTLYRLGGYIKSVSHDLSTVTLFNPYAGKQWTLKTSQPGKRVRLYLFKRGTSDETATIRKLITQLQNGQIRVIKN